MIFASLEKTIYKLFRSYFCGIGNIEPCGGADYEDFFYSKNYSNTATPPAQSSYPTSSYLSPWQQPPHPHHYQNMCPPWFSYPYPRYPSWPYHPSHHLQEFNNQTVYQQEQPVSRQPQQSHQQHSVITTSSVAATSFSHPVNHDSQTSCSRNYFKPIIVSSHNTDPPNDLRVKDIEEANDKKREARILDTPLFARGCV